MSRDVAIDLGTANTLVYVRGRGIVLREPTLLAMDERTGDVVAMGAETWDAVESSPRRLTAVRPLRNGAITDFELTERLIRLVFGRAGIGRFTHPRALVCVSSVITPVERRAVEEAAEMAGARSAMLIDEPLAAAIGADLPIDQPWGNCIVDVGGGTTEVAVISMGGVVASRAIRTGGFDLDDEVREYLRREHALVVGERTAEQIKMELGSAAATPDEVKGEVAGRDLQTGLPKTVTISSEELRVPLHDRVGLLVEAVRQTLSETPPELAHDVIERGITLAGGGALLRGLDVRLSEEIDVPVRVADQPLDTVCLGAGRVLSDLESFREQGLVQG